MSIYCLGRFVNIYDSSNMLESSIFGLIIKMVHMAGSVFMFRYTSEEQLNEFFHIPSLNCRYCLPFVLHLIQVHLKGRSQNEKRINWVSFVILNWKYFLRYVTFWRDRLGATALAQDFLAQAVFAPTDLARAYFGICSF